MSQPTMTNTGLVLPADFAGFKKRGTGKKVTESDWIWLRRESVMLELASICGNLPMGSSELTSVIYTRRGGPHDVTAQQAFDDLLLTYLEEDRRFTPPRWRDLHTGLILIYLQRAMDDMGGGYAVTLNLAPELLLKALDQDKELGYLFRAVNRVLKRALGRSIPCYLVLETSCKERRKVEGRPHLHGAVLCSDDQLAQVKQALKGLHRAASIDFKKRGRPTQLRKIYDGHNWARYSGKARGHMRLILPDLAGSGFVASNALRRTAKQIYDADCLAVKQRVEALRAGVTG